MQCNESCRAKLRKASTEGTLPHQQQPSQHIVQRSPEHSLNSMPCHPSEFPFSKYLGLTTTKAVIKRIFKKL